MALINNIYVLAEKEDVEGDVELVTHPTESGFPISDGIKKSPISVSISGKIANTESLTAKQIVEKLNALKNQGSVIKFVGQCGTINNLQIASFKPSYSHKNYGGADFSMTLKEFKTAKSAYVAPSKLISKVISVIKKLVVGTTVKFAGGNVYVSSDAKTPSAKRGASVCRLTKISTLKNAKHKYHLISKDCKYGSSNYVYGWVDADKVSAVSSNTTGSTNGGTQQVQSDTTKDVIYHTVKKGETIWGLVNKTYKSKGLSVNEVIEDNAKAFSVKGAPTTLQTGAKLKLKLK